MRSTGSSRSTVELFQRNEEMGAAPFPQLGEHFQQPKGHRSEKTGPFESGVERFDFSRQKRVWCVVKKFSILVGNRFENRATKRRTKFDGHLQVGPAKRGEFRRLENLAMLLVLADFVKRLLDFVHGVKNREVTPIDAGLIGARPNTAEIERLVQNGDAAGKGATFPVLHHVVIGTFAFGKKDLTVGEKIGFPEFQYGTVEIVKQIDFFLWCQADRREFGIELRCVEAGFGSGHAKVNGVRFGLFCFLKRFFAQVEGEPIIGIGEIGVSTINGGISGISRASGALVGLMKNGEAGIGSIVFVENVGRSVGGPIVDAKDLNLRQCLFRNGIETLPQIRRDIINGKYDGNFRRHSTTAVESKRFSA